MTSLAIIPTIDSEIVDTESTLATQDNHYGFSNEDALIHAWIAQRSPATKTTYTQAFKEFKQLGYSLECSFSQLIDYRDYLEQAYKVTTANKKLSAIRSLLNFAFDFGYISQNPAKKIENIKKSKDKLKQSKSVTERILSHEEVKMIYNHASNSRDRAMVKTAYILGLRIHELLNLHWQDFSRKNDGQWQVKVIGKGSKERFVDVPDYLYNELKALNTDGYIFQNYKGNKLTAVSAHRILKTILNQADLSPDISWHWFRHSMVSHSLKNGASLESIRKKAGHSSIAVTNVYWHDDEDANDFISL